MAGERPVQPLPVWLSRIYLPDPAPGTGSRLVTIEFPQTYSGASIPGLTWPYVTANANNPLQGTLVSILGQSRAGLTRLGGTATRTGASIARTTAVAASTAASAVQGSSRSLDLSRTRSGNAFTTNEGSFVSPTSTQPASSTSTQTFTRQTSVSSSSLPSGFSSSASVPSITSSALQTASSSTSSPNVDRVASSGLSDGAIAGVVIGSLAAIILFLLLLFLVCRRRSRRKRAYSQPNLSDRNDEETAHLALPRAGQGSNGPEMVSRGAAFLPVRTSTSAETMGLMQYRDLPDDTRYGDSNDMCIVPRDCQTIAVADAQGRTRHPSAATESTQPSQSTGGSTTTRGSLIAQFPVYARKRSGGSDDDSPEAGTGFGSRTAGQGGSGGNSGGVGTGSGDSRGTMASTDLFTVAPARPPSRTRTVPDQSGPTETRAAVGLGRPSAIPMPVLRSNAGQSRLESRDSVGQSRSSSGPVHMPSSPARTRSLAATRSTNHRIVSDTGGMVGWLGGFAFLRPYLSGNTPLPTTPTRAGSVRRRHPKIVEEEDVESGIAEIGDMEERDTVLMPSDTPVDRSGPDYRRVTTTAAAYDTADLADLRRAPGTIQSRPLIFSTGLTGQATDAPEQRELRRSDGNTVEEEAEDESQSFLSASQGGGSPTRSGPLVLPGLSAATTLDRRGSKTTLGRPIRRGSDFSGISQISLADARSISESIVGSVRAARSRSSSQGHLTANSRSPSRSGSSDKLNSSTTRSKPVVPRSAASLRSRSQSPASRSQRLPSDMGDSHDSHSSAGISRVSTLSSKGSRGKRSMGPLAGPSLEPASRRNENGSGSSGASSSNGQLSRGSTRSEASGTGSASGSNGSNRLRKVSEQQEGEAGPSSLSTNARARQRPPLPLPLPAQPS